MRLRPKPLISPGAKDRNKAIALFRGVIEEYGVIHTLYRDGKILKAAPVASPNVVLGHIVTAR